MKSLIAWLKEFPYSTAKTVAGEERVLYHLGTAEHGMHARHPAGHSPTTVNLDLVQASAQTAVRFRFGLSGEWLSAYFRMDQVEELRSMLVRGQELASHSTPADER